MTRENDEIRGFILASEKGICQSNNCHLLREMPVEGQQVPYCQPGVLADGYGGSGYRKQRVMTLYQSEFPEAGCSRNLDLDHKHWRVYGGKRSRFSSRPSEE
jgi:hypothetical protein